MRASGDGAAPQQGACLKGTGRGQPDVQEKARGQHRPLRRPTRPDGRRAAALCLRPQAAPAVARWLSSPRPLQSCAGGLGPVPRPLPAGSTASRRRGHRSDGGLLSPWGPSLSLVLLGTRQVAAWATWPSTAQAGLPGACLPPLGPAASRGGPSGSILYRREAGPPTHPAGRNEALSGMRWGTPFPALP